MRERQERGEPAGSGALLAPPSEGVMGEKRGWLCSPARLLVLLFCSARGGVASSSAVLFIGSGLSVCATGQADHHDAPRQGIGVRHRECGKIEPFISINCAWAVSLYRRPSAIEHSKKKRLWPHPRRSRNPPAHRHFTGTLTALPPCGAGGHPRIDGVTARSSSHESHQAIGLSRWRSCVCWRFSE